MENIRQASTENTRIQEILDSYLASRRMLKSSAAETSAHLDEDMLAAFAEGTLSERETAPFLSHVIDCGFCRHKTAELVRLDLELEGTNDSVIAATPTEPSTISAVLSQIMSKIFGTADGAVFAHEEKDEEEAKESDEDSNR